MKILIGPQVCGLSRAYTKDLIHTLFKQTPQYFAYDGEIRHPDFWTEDTDYGIIATEEGGLFRLDLWYTSDYGRALRTDPKVHELFETLGKAEGFKIIDIPDDVSWYVSSGDDGSECIHEEHRVWC